MISEKVIASDGIPLAARFYFPENRKAKGAVLIAPAMSAPQSYYQPFAEWLAREGYVAATFDYRGTGESREDRFRLSLRGYKADVIDWARLDCGAMVDALAARAPSLPFYWVGHSLGGQILGFVPNRERIAKAITVATGSGYWLENAPSLRKRVWWLWFVVAPLATALFGYFPGSKLRKVGDLPRGVIEQWRRWCLHPDYAVGDGEAVRAQYAAVRMPIVSLSFLDDELMSARNTESIHGFYVNAPRSMKRIGPREIGARRIGHFGFFRREFSDSLWRAHILPELVTGAGENDFETLRELNRNYIRAAAESDVQWYADNLADDYRATNPDGSFVDKAGFLARFAGSGPKKDYDAVDMNIRILGEVALIHSGFVDRRPDGTVGGGRYTDIYARRGGRWLCVCAHFVRC